MDNGPIDVARLLRAVDALYQAGHWSCDRQVDEFALWNELKRAAGVPHGTAPKCLNSPETGPS